MNFLISRVEHITRQPMFAPSFSGKVALGVAGTIIFLEFLVLWQFVQPIGLVLGEPTQAPRPAMERVGILKRF